MQTLSIAPSHARDVMTCHLSSRPVVRAYPTIERFRPRRRTSANLLNEALHCLDEALYAAMTCSKSFVAACVTVMARSKR